MRKSEKKMEFSYSQLPYSEITLILAHILKKSREFVLAHPEIRLNKRQKTEFDELAKRRMSHEPMAYILGNKEFYGLDFRVTKDTLIPRPETELMVENIINLKPKSSVIVDLGTGSGNIIISLAKNIKEKNNYIAVDTSPKSLSVAKRNAEKNNVSSKIKFIRSDLLKNKKLLNELKNKNLIIAANLPYLSEKIYNSTAPDVKNFEPKSALLSGKDGLDHYRKLFQQIKIILDSRSLSTVRCFLEISPEQKTAINGEIKKYLPDSKAKFHKDLSGRWRMAEIELN